MTDIVERLQRDCPCSGDIGCADALCAEAAAEIVRLRADKRELLVSGYKPQSDEKVALVNENKVLEERVLRQLDAMKANPAFDQRMVSIAYTGIQEAFMWANRAVFQPGRVKLPEDAD